MLLPGSVGLSALFSPSGWPEPLPALPEAWWPLGPCSAVSVFPLGHHLGITYCVCTQVAAQTPSQALLFLLQAARPADPPVEGAPGPGGPQLATCPVHHVHLHHYLL